MDLSNLDANKILSKAREMSQKTFEEKFCNNIPNLVDSIVSNIATPGAMAKRRTMSNAGSVCDSNCVEADNSSLGILSLANMSDFSLPDMNKSKPGTFLKQKNSVEESNGIMDIDIGDLGNISSFESSESEKRLWNLFGDKTEEVKAILSGSSTLSKKQSSSTADLRSNSSLQRISIDNRPVNRTYSSPHTPIDNKEKMKTVVDMDTPFTKLLNFRASLPTDDSVSSFANPFGDRSSFQKDSILDTPDCEKLEESEVVFREDQISARSSTISSAEANSENQNFESLAFQANFSHEFQDDIVLDVSDSEFRSGENAIKMFEADYKVFNLEQESELDCSKLEHISIWSVADQPDKVSRPSWMSANSSAISQISVGQMFQAKTEHLGTLSDDPRRERPFFGEPVLTPRKSNSDESHTIEDNNKFNTVVSDNSFAASPSLSISTISRILSEVSVGENPASVLLAARAGNRKVMKLCANPVSNNDNHKGVIPYATKNASADHYEIMTSCESNKVLKDKKSLETVVIDQHVTQNKSDYNNEINRVQVFDDDEEENVRICAIGAEIPTSSKNDNHVAQWIDNNTVSLPAEEEEKVSFSKSAEVRLKHGRRPTKAVQSFSSLKDNDQSGLTGSIGPEAPQYCHSDSDGSEVSTRTTSTCKSIPAAPCCQHVHPPCVYSACTPVMPPCNGVGVHNALVRRPSESSLSTYSYPGMLNVPANGQMWQLSDQFSPFPRPIMLQHGQNFVPSDSANVKTKVVFGPTEFIFPCVCVGHTVNAILVLQCISQVPLYHNITLLSATANGKKFPLEMIALQVPAYVCSSASGPFEIKMSYIPKFENEIKVELQVVSVLSLDAVHPAHYVGQPFLIDVNLSSEKPNLSFSCDGNSRLTFEKVYEESVTMRYIDLTNKGKADVIVYLSIKEANDYHSFEFGMDSEVNSNIVEIFHQSSKSMSCKIKGATSADGVVYHIPVMFCATKSRKHEEENRCDTVISAKVDNKWISLQLTPVTACASVGTIYLWLHGLYKDMICLKSRVGHKMNKKLSMVNTGNIFVEADLAVQCEDNCFSVQPQTVKLKPKVVAELSVYFEPAIVGTFRGVLQAAPQGTNQVFDLGHIDGIAIPSPYSQSISNFIDSSSEQPFMVQSTKRYLHWGGLKIGESVEKSFKILNSANSVLYAKALIKSKGPEFKLIEDGTNEKVSSVDFALDSGKWRKFTIVFTPTSQECYSSDFLVKSSASDLSSRFAIPLCAYGGVCDIIPTDLWKLAEKKYILHWNNFETNIFTLHNSGSRPAFVKIITTKDEKDCVPLSGFQVNPSQFVLQSQESQVVQVRYEDETEEEAVLLVYFGEELMRQQIRRFSEPYHSLRSNPLSSINFNIYFDNEEHVHVQCDDSYKESNKDYDTFYETVRKLVISISICDTSSRSSFEPLTLMLHETVMSLFPMGKKEASFSPPEKDSSHASIAQPKSVSKRLSYALPAINVPEVTVSECVPEASGILSSFSVEPASLMLNSECRDGRLLINNLSQKEMRFKLAWSADIISASPNQGSIQPNESMGIRVKAIGHFNGKDQDVHEGYVKVITLCGKQHIPVYLNKRKKCSIVLLHCPQIVIADKTLVGSYSETRFVIQNIGDDNLTWRMSPQSSTSEVATNAISFFSLSPSFGVLLPSLSCNISVKFSPSKAGFLSEKWCVTTESSSDVKKDFEITFKGVGFLKSVSSDQSCINDISKLGPKSKKVLSIEPKAIVFGNTHSYAKLHENITIGNYTSNDCNLTILKPNPPFSVDRSSITVKSHCYTTLLVTFYPRKANHYAGELCFKTEDGTVYEVKLEGICS